ncbi:hypothetical protein INT44_000114, partial [Umbelopsis vinacea]
SLWSLALPIVSCLSSSHLASPSSTPAKPANLPSTTWVITSLDPSARDTLCARQVDFCSSNCVGVTEVLSNFCNASTLAFACTCKHPLSDALKWQWPVAVADCQGKLEECQSKCAAEPDPSRNSCTYDCISYYQCGTSNAPPAYLMTNNITDVPAYSASPTHTLGPGGSISGMESNAPNPSNSTSGSFKSYSLNVLPTALAFFVYISSIAQA